MTTLLEKAIEIEGIIRILRDGRPTPDVYALLKRKTSELAAEAAALQPAPAVHAVATPAAEEADDIILSFEDEPQEAAPVAVATPKRQEERKPAPKSLKALFSLNDRYLYSRELFDGNMKMFDATLDFIEGVENYSDIEDYFYNELEWDPDNATAATFLETLRPHFKD